MDGWTIFFIFFFTIAALVPALWSIGGLIRGNRGFWPGVVGVGWAVVLMVVTIVGIATKWGGCSSGSATSADAITCYNGTAASGCKPDVWKVECGRSSPGCAAILPGAFCPKGQKPVFVFCEPFQSGGVKQPWATWSDLSFIAAGLWLLWFLQYFAVPGTLRLDSAIDNPMITIGWLSVTYGMIVIFMGPPSQWFHASIKEWAGWFDSMSVVIWLTFNAVYVWYMIIAAMWGRGRGIARPITVLCFWLGLGITFGAIGAKFPDARLIFYFISGGLWGVAEVVYASVAASANGVTYRRTWWLFVINVSVLAVTMGIWIFFNDGIVKTGCIGRQDIPGHAFFHILASFSTMLTFLSFASERRVSS